MLGYGVVLSGIMILIIIAIGVLSLFVLVFMNLRKKTVPLATLADKKKFMISDDKSADYKEALLNSKGYIASKRLKEKIPDELEKIYFSDEDILYSEFDFSETFGDRKKVWHIACFVPASEAIKDNQFIFASDGMGNHYFYKLDGVLNGDAVVFFYDHEFDETHEIYPSVNDFLNLEKTVKI